MGLVHPLEGAEEEVELHHLCGRRRRFTTGTGGGGGVAAAAGTLSSFSGRGGTFIFNFGGCLVGKSSYSTIFFFDFLFDEGGGPAFGGGEGLLGSFGGNGGRDFSASWATGGDVSLDGSSGMLLFGCF